MNPQNRVSPGVRDIICCVVVQEVREADVGFVIVSGRVVRGVVDGVEGVVVAVDDLHVGCVTAPIVVGDIATVINCSTGTGRVIILWLSRSSRFPRDTRL